MSIIDTLITNRVPSGFYGIEDLNRVGEAMYYVAERLRSCGWDIEVSPRTDWVLTDRATPSAAKRYLDNLRRLRSTLVLFATTPEAPSGETPFDALEANDIEKILIDIEDMVQRTQASYFYSGDLFAGEV